MTDANRQPKLDALHDRIADALEGLAPLFKHHTLTFVARNTEPGLDAHVIVTSDDDLLKVASAVAEYAGRPATTGG